jgi:valyl-tRNA synthetase
MSKTKGNVVDPLEAISTAGADALRFALVNGTSPGNDQKFRNEKLEDGRNFANKLWNATRYVLGARPATIAPGPGRRAPSPATMGVAERWIASRASATVGSVDRAFDEDNYGEAARVLYEAIWSEFCDWGLEVAKTRLADGALSDAEREATWWTLVAALDSYLRLLHPVMPFVTEELWGALPHGPEDPPFLMSARWPVAGPREAGTETAVGAIIELIRGIRNARAEGGVAASAWLQVDVLVPSELISTFEALRPAIERLARARPLLRHVDREALVAMATGGLAVVGGEMEAIVTAADVAVTQGERQRLERELGDAERQLGAARARLADPAFLERAPAQIVDGARSRAVDLAERVELLRESLAR